MALSISNVAGSNSYFKPMPQGGLVNFGGSNSLMTAPTPSFNMGGSTTPATPAPGRSNVSMNFPVGANMSPAATTSAYNTINKTSPASSFDISSFTPQQQALYKTALSLAPSSTTSATTPATTTPQFTYAQTPSVSPVQSTPAQNTSSQGGLYAPGYQPLPQTSGLEADQQKAANQGKPGYDIFGNPISNTAPTTPTAPTQTPTQGVASNIVNPNLNATIQALIQQAQSGSPQQAQAQKDLTAAIERERQLEQNYADQTYNIKNAGTDLSLQTGQQQNLSQQFGGREAAAQAAIQQEQAALGQAQTQQTQQLGALQAAAGLQTPGQQYTQVSPGNYLANAQGEAVGGGQGAGISSYQNFQTAKTNADISTNYQTQAVNIGGALKVMNSTGQKLSDFLTKTGLNPAMSPLANQQISTINSQIYPGEVATLHAAAEDIKSYALQILGTNTDGTPSGLESAIASYDFTNFTPTELNVFLSNLENLGNVRLSEAQNISQTARNANLTGGGAPALGPKATDVGTLQTNGVLPSGNTGNVIKALGGGAINLGGAVGNAASVVSGAVGGLVEHVLGGL